MADHHRYYDLVIIGTGSAGFRSGLPVSCGGVEGRRHRCPPLGGTCALRGCHPKKMLVSAAEVIDATTRMAGKGVHAHRVAIRMPRPRGTTPLYQR